MSDEKEFNEQELIKRTKEGDSRAFDKLMEHHYKFIENVASRYTDYKVDTEEVVQESMMKIWMNIDKFRGDSKLSTWIFIITANTSKKNLTSRVRVPSHPHNQTVQYTHDHSSDDEIRDDSDIGSIYNAKPDSVFGTYYDSPEDELIAERLAEAIFDQAEKLTPDLYEALYLREIELMSYEDISETLGIPLGTCKSRLYNARTVLDDKLKRHLGEESTKRFQISV